MIIYIIGIMLYKFGLEAFNGSLVALATNRYDNDAKVTNTVAKTFGRIGLLQGLNQAFQCVGAILIAPLIKRYPTKLVLSVAVFTFGLLTIVLLVVDAGTGGRFRPKGAKSNDFSYYGKYNTDGIIPIFCFTGIAYGMVELIRRVIPRDIVGGNVQKLRRMDAIVHIFYEVSGTAAAFCTSLALIPALGTNYSFIITPILFTLAAITWYFISNLDFKPAASTILPNSPTYVRALVGSFFLFLRSCYLGMKIVFTSRKFIWLLPAYSVALYAHRYLENGIAPIIARRYLGNSAWSQIMVGGSNFGELLGALFVFLFTNVVRTPIPWLRLDALCLLIVWYLAYWYPPMGDVKYAWMVAGTFIPISFGWAAGDVSLAAYIQASLARLESGHQDVSALGAVMAFLYSAYIITYAITSPLLGQYVDKVSKRTKGDVHEAVMNIAGVQFTIIMVVVIAATFIPRGAWSLNPKMLERQDLDWDLKDSEGRSEDGTGDGEDEGEVKEKDKGFVSTSMAA